MKVNKLALIDRVPRWSWDTPPAKYVDDKITRKPTKQFKAKKRVFHIERVCEHCGNTCSLNGTCDFCGATNDKVFLREEPQF